MVELVLCAGDGGRHQTSRPFARFRSIGFDSYLVVLNYFLTFPGHAFRLHVLRSLARCKVGADSSVQRGVRLTTKGGVSIGVGCNINRGTVLDGRGALTIGDLVNISSDVTILTADHDPDSEFFEGRVRSVTIGSRSWLATRALILPGSTVGEGAVIAAGAVVNGDVPPWTVVAGVPAKQVGLRNPKAQRVLPAYRRWLH
jgi:acetyltransferase-like isoleucine patch superfamily enzyme